MGPQDSQKENMPPEPTSIDGQGQPAQPTQEAIPQAQSTDPQPMQSSSAVEDPPKKRNWINIAIYILIPIILVILAVVGYQNYQLRQQLKARVSTSPPPSTPVPSPTPTTTSPTVELETYTNNEGFTFKYPSNMKLSSPDTFDPSRFAATEYNNIGLQDIQYSQNSFSNDPHLKINVLSKSLGTLEQQAQEYFDKNTTKENGSMEVVNDITQSIFNGYDSYEYTLSGSSITTPSSGYVGYNGNYKFIWVENDNATISIIYTTDETQFDQILSTFEFTE